MVTNLITSRLLCANKDYSCFQIVLICSDRVWKKTPTFPHVAWSGGVFLMSFKISFNLKLTLHLCGQKEKPAQLRRFKQSALVDSQSLASNK